MSYVQWQLRGPYTFIHFSLEEDATSLGISLPFFDLKYEWTSEWLNNWLLVAWPTIKLYS